MGTYLNNEIFETLRARIASKITDSDSGLAIARQASLNTIEIKYSGTPKMISDSILSRAEEEGKVSNVIDAVMVISGEDELLEEIKVQISSGASYKLPPTAIQGSVVSLEKPQVPQVLLIYDQEDEQIIQSLINQLHILTIEGNVKIIDLNYEVKHGAIEEKEKVIILKSCIVLPVLTPNFFKIRTNHLVNLRIAFEAKKIIVPILMRHCLYGRVSVLSGIKTLPANEKFVSKNNEEEDFYKISLGVLRIIESDEFKQCIGYN